MTVTIPDELGEFVRRKVESGEFKNPGDVVAAALGAWQGSELMPAMDVAAVEHALLQAIDSPRIPWDEANLDGILESLRTKYGAA